MELLVSLQDTARVGDAPRKMTNHERAKVGNLARRLKEPWDSMTEAARKSPNNPANLERWVAEARRLNPALSDEQAERLGAELLSSHFSKLAGKRWHPDEAQA